MEVPAASIDTSHSGHPRGGGCVGWKSVWVMCRMSWHLLEADLLSGLRKKMDKVSLAQTLAPLSLDPFSCVQVIYMPVMRSAFVSVKNIHFNFC